MGDQRFPMTSYGEIRRCDGAAGAIWGFDSDPGMKQNETTDIGNTAKSTE
jgi:hypothetical protein